MEEKITLRELRERVGRSIAAKKRLVIQGGELMIDRVFIRQAG